MNVVRGGSCRRRDKYAAYHSRSSAFVVRIWWLSYGAWNRLLRWWRYQPDHPHRDYPAAAQGHLRPPFEKTGTWRDEGWGNAPAFVSIRSKVRPCGLAVLQMTQCARRIRHEEGTRRSSVGDESSSQLWILGVVSFIWEKHSRSRSPKESAPCLLDPFVFSPVLSRCLPSLLFMHRSAQHLFRRQIPRPMRESPHASPRSSSR